MNLQSENVHFIKLSVTIAPYSKARGINGEPSGRYLANQVKTISVYKIDE